MQQLFSLLLSVFIASVGAAVVPAAEPNQLHKIPLNKPPAKVTVVSGDLLELDYSYPVVPGSMPSGLKVEVSGQELSKVGVVSVPNETSDGKRIIGASILSAFLKADMAGEVKLKITPVGVENPVTVELKVKVKAK